MTGVFALLCTAVALLPAQGDSALQRLIARGRLTSLRWERFPDVQQEAQGLYARNGWTPLWIAGGQPTLMARALLGTLATSGDAGLDPEDYAASQLAALATTLVRQLPGAWNSLGSIKFMMPNNFNIYLHDTPARNLFDRPRRDFSHGCIRVADPVLLAELLLRDHPTWTPARIKEVMAASTPTRVNFRRKTPVLVLYGTAVARENGQVFFYQDSYGHHARLGRLLATGYPYPRR